ncbi:MAG: GGDEF domain-containing protein [Campylobacteraceae bacterium]|nr:GGDEF domain-containing protein [Campylobacteraceae bacterium]
MNINKKVSLLFIIIFIFSFSLISFIVKSRVVNIENIEKKIIINNIKKVQSILNNYYEKVDNISYEYSTHDLLLNYIKNSDTNSLNNFFINKPDFMKKLNLSYFILLDENKNPLISKYYDLSSEEQMSVPDELYVFLKQLNLEKLNENNKNRYITLNFEKVLFSLEKVLINNELSGYVFTGRVINSTFLTKISEIIGDYGSLVSSYEETSFDKINFENENIDYKIKIQDEQNLFYYLSFYDILENKKFFIRFQNSREVYNNMIVELKYILALFIALLLITVIVFFIFINKLFVNRINYIANIVKKVSLNETLKYQLKVSYDDEISYLIRRINEMFRVINAQQDLNLKKERDFLQSVLDTQQNIIMITDGKEIQSVNRKFKEIFFNTENFLENIALIDNRTKANFMAVAKRYNNKDMPAKFSLMDNQEKYFTFQVSKLDCRKYLICMNDVSTLNHKIKHLTFKANIDELTSVYNKSTVTNYAKKWLADKDFSMIIFDIDYFKKINDNYGHYVGDCILKEMTKLISQEISKSDILGRIGGEEFLLLIDDTSSINVIKIANRIRKIVEKKVFAIDEHRIFVTISMGCTVCIFDEKFETIYKRADEALYEAKKTGRNKVIFY